VSAADSLGARDEDGDVAERLGPLVGDAAVGEDVLVSASRGKGFLSGHEPSGRESGGERDGSMGVDARDVEEEE